ncbi:hypothetical protein BKA62DRAFT_822157 [Auriculariales sp. MPI-PUGE-AT-0066]|nr:hypothetical protein BKA62DRAFT_822157 [Auriculariales sp. MPI-PUGE-AT-0066]
MPHSPSQDTVRSFSPEADDNRISRSYEELLRSNDQTENRWPEQLPGYRTPPMNDNSQQRIVQEATQHDGGMQHDPGWSQEVHASLGVDRQADNDAYSPAQQTEEIVPDSQEESNRHSDIIEQDSIHVSGSQEVQTSSLTPGLGSVSQEHPEQHATRFFTGIFPTRPRRHLSDWKFDSQESSVMEIDPKLVALGPDTQSHSVARPLNIAEANSSRTRLEKDIAEIKQSLLELKQSQTEHFNSIMSMLRKRRYDHEDEEVVLQPKRVRVDLA